MGIATGSSQPEKHGVDQPNGRARRLRAAVASVPASVQRPSLASEADRGHPTAEAAPDPSGEHVAAPPGPGDGTSVCGRELLRAQQRLVVAWEPLSVQEHLSQVDAGVRDGSCCRVLHPRELLDPRVAEGLRAKVEDPADGGRDRHQGALPLPLLGQGCKDRALNACSR
jgi:hypothetical protein